METLFWGLNLLELSLLSAYAFVVLVFLFGYLWLQSSGKAEKLTLRFYRWCLWVFIVLTVIITNVLFFENGFVSPGALVCVTLLGAVSGAFIHWFLWSFAGLPEFRK